ncbi:MAG: hypothetical protein ICV74_04130 [Thermoleophilia bacterium]|nr:hypothetical protein [Thermoleophilia bacterium]
MNQVARSRPADVDRLLAAADRLRIAQASGEGDLRSPVGEEREAVRSLVGSARDFLAASGRTASDSTLAAVERTLNAAAADPDLHDDLRRGILTREVEASGFAGLLGVVEARPARRRAGPTREERAAARAALRHARAEAEGARAEAAAAAREVARLQDALRRAEGDAERALERAKEAELEVERLRED